MDKARMILALLLAAVLLLAGCGGEKTVSARVGDAAGSPETTVPAQSTPAGSPDALRQEMLGLWELAWTEVEGDRIEAEPGACTVEIFMSASNGFLMSYTSREFPHQNFENEPLTFDERELHHGCGNDAWVADLDHVGPWNTTYAFTLTVDDILIKQNYYLLDGAPTVSYEYFRRAVE